MTDEKILERASQIYELNHTTSHLIYQYITKTTKYPLSPSQRWLLWLLKEHGTRTPSDVAQVMGVTSGAVTSLADRLCKQNLINRERSKKDRRVVELSLTPKGEEMIEAIQQEILTRLAEICSKLTEDDIQNAKHIFTKVKTILEELLSEGQRRE